MGAYQLFLDDSLLYPLRQPPTIGRFSPPLDAASKSTLSLRPLERPGLHSSCGIAAVETRKWRMSDLLDDDAFDDIFGDTSGTSSLGIQSGDKGSVLEDSAKKVDLDYLIETDFDDIFGSLDSPVGSPSPTGKSATTMSFEDELLKVEKLKAGTTSSVVDDIAAAFAEADSIVDSVNTLGTTSIAEEPLVPSTPEKSRGDVNASTSVPVPRDTTEFNDGTSKVVRRAMLAIETAAAVAESESYDVAMRRSTSPRRSSLSMDHQDELTLKIKTELASSRPDLQTIRDICREYGGVPASHRSILWALFLGVSSAAAHDSDLELSMLHSKDSKSPTAFPHQNLLREEVMKAASWAATALVPANTSSGGVTDSCANTKLKTENIAVDMETLLVFYIKRRSIKSEPEGPIDYFSGLADTVAPFYASGAGASGAIIPNTTVVFQCLYALCSAFIPTAHALSSPRNPWPEMMFHQFKVLLKYHDPALEAHFSQIDISWATPSADLIPSSCFFRCFAGELSHSGILRLWDYLLLEADPYFPWFLVAALFRNAKDILQLTKTKEQLKHEIEQCIALINTSSGLESSIVTAVKLDAETPKSFRKNLRRISGDLVHTPPKKTRSVDWYNRFWDFYMVHNPEKLEDALSLLKKEEFVGKEALVARRCEKKYNSPMTGLHQEMNLPFLSVTAEEIIPQVIESSQRYLRYFLVDCRPANETEGGRFGQAWSLSPQVLKDGKVCADLIDSLSGIKGHAHIVVMGSGRDQLLEKFSLAEASRYAIHDCETVTRCGRAFVDAGFPFVSVVQGGFLSCYRFMEKKYTIGGLVDVSPHKCRPLRSDQYQKFESEDPMRANLFREHVLHSLAEKAKKEAQLCRENGDPEVEAALAMAMESAKIGQTLKDKKNRESWDKLKNNVGAGLGRINLIAQKSVSSMRTAFDELMVEDIDSEPLNDREKGMNALHEEAPFSVFSIDDDGEEDDSFDIFRDHGGMTPTRSSNKTKVHDASANNELRPIVMTTEEGVPLVVLGPGSVLAYSLFCEIINESKRGNYTIFECVDMYQGKWARTIVETHLLEDRLVVTKRFSIDTNNFPVLARRASLEDKKQAALLFSKMQARIAAEKAKAASKEISRRFSSIFSKGGNQEVLNQPSVVHATMEDDEPPAREDELHSHEGPVSADDSRECVKVLCNQSLKALKKMTIKKGDVNIVTLYFADDSTVIKFKDREHFQKCLKLNLSQMRGKKQ